MVNRPENITFLGNAFSLQMLEQPTAIIQTLPIRDVEIRDGKIRYSVMTTLCCRPFISVVGHADTAKVLGVDYYRKNIKLQDGDRLIVAQLVGGRLPEGATTLPEGYKFEFLEVRVSY